MASLETVSLGGLLMWGGTKALAGGTVAGAAAGAFWIVVGGEIVWIGVDIFQGLADRFTNPSQQIKAIYP